MKKLFEKSEIWFAVLGIVVYVPALVYGGWLFCRRKKTGAKLFACGSRTSEPLFRPAKESEKKEILKLYDAVKSSAFCVWDEDYPGPAEWEQDFETGNLFVLADGDRIVGVISLLPENELSDLGIWPKEQEAFEFARVAVAPEYQGRGLAALLVRNVEKVAVERGGKRFHILAAPGNLPAVRTYEKLGYKKVGECFTYGHDYLAMEKELSRTASSAGCR